MNDNSTVKIRPLTQPVSPTNASTPIHSEYHLSEYEFFDLSRSNSLQIKHLNNIKSQLIKRQKYKKKLEEVYSVMQLNRQKHETRYNPNVLINTKKKTEDIENKAILSEIDFNCYQTIITREQKAINIMSKKVEDLRHKLSETDFLQTETNQIAQNEQKPDESVTQIEEDIEKLKTKIENGKKLIDFLNLKVQESKSKLSKNDEKEIRFLKKSQGLRKSIKRITEQHKNYKEVIISMLILEEYLTKAAKKIEEKNQIVSSNETKELILQSERIQCSEKTEQYHKKRLYLYKLKSELELLKNQRKTSNLHRVKFTGRSVILPEKSFSRKFEIEDPLEMVEKIKEKYAIIQRVLNGIKGLFIKLSKEQQDFEIFKSSDLKELMNLENICSFSNIPKISQFCLLVEQKIISLGFIVLQQAKYAKWIIQNKNEEDFVSENFQEKTIEEIIYTLRKYKKELTYTQTPQQRYRREKTSFTNLPGKPPITGEIIPILNVTKYYSKNLDDGFSNYSPSNFNDPAKGNVSPARKFVARLRMQQTMRNEEFDMLSIQPEHILPNRQPRRPVREIITIQEPSKQTIENLMAIQAKFNSARIKQIADMKKSATGIILSQAKKQKIVQNNVPAIESNAETIFKLTAIYSAHQHKKDLTKSMENENSEFNTNPYKNINKADLIEGAKLRIKNLKNYMRIQKSVSETLINMQNNNEIPKKLKMNNIYFRKSLALKSSVTSPRDSVDMPRPTNLQLFRRCSIDMNIPNLIKASSVTPSTANCSEKTHKHTAIY